MWRAGIVSGLPVEGKWVYGEKLTGGKTLWRNESLVWKHTDGLFHGADLWGKGTLPSVKEGEREREFGEEEKKRKSGSFSAANSCSRFLSFSYSFPSFPFLYSRVPTSLRPWFRPSVPQATTLLTRKFCANFSGKVGMHAYTPTCIRE